MAQGGGGIIGALFGYVAGDRTAEGDEAVDDRHLDLVGLHEARAVKFRDDVASNQFVGQLFGRDDDKSPSVRRGGAGRTPEDASPVRRRRRFRGEGSDLRPLKLQIRTILEERRSMSLARCPLSVVGG